MKNIKKILALVLAVMMIAALAVPAMAVGEAELGEDKSVVDGTTVISDAGVKQDWQSDHYNALGNTVRIDKEIIIFNTRTENTIVYLPNVKFNYAITAATVTDGTPTIKDEKSISAKVKSGVSAALSTTSADVTYSNVNGITTGSTTISSATYVTTTSSGTPAAGYFDITFNPANFGSAGIYRYVITETEDATLTRVKAGVTSTSYNNVRYLDVYVRNNTAGTGLEIYGYVLFEDSTDAQNKSFDVTAPKLTAKTNGFVSDKNDSNVAYSVDETDVDLYLTSNVKIQKLVDGALGDKNNEFPFSATIANTTITSDPIISFQVINDSATLATDSASNPTKTMVAGTTTIGAAAAITADGFKLDDQDYIYIYGIPGKNEASTVIASEYNNTYDIYTVSAKYDTATAQLVDNDDETTAADSVNIKRTNVATLSASKSIDITKTEDELVVTNTLNEVSPTGITLRFAPYALILAMGTMLLLFSRKARKTED